MQPTSAYDLWPSAVGLDRLPAAGGSGSGDAPAIAVVDSGVEPDRVADFGGRVVASVNLSSSTPSATGAEIVSLRVVGADGSALTSDVIAAADWTT